MDRNVVLIVLDTVRKDHFDDYATRLAAVSDTTFKQCRAASSWSTPSHASIFTGGLPQQHGLHADSFGGNHDFSSINYSETFLNNLDGYRAVGYSANPYVNSLYGFDKFFDEFTDFVSGDAPFPDGLSFYEYKHWIGAARGQTRYILESLRHPKPVKSLINGAWAKFGVDVGWLPIPGLIDRGASVISSACRSSAIEGSEPFFMFANFMDAHTPLRNRIQFDIEDSSVSNRWSSEDIHQWEVNKDGLVDEDFFAKYRSVYAAAVDYLDQTVANLVDAIQNATDLETTVIITADHGHNLGYQEEDSLIHHAGSMSEGIMHVPLEIINPPQGYPDRVSKFFSQLQLGEMIVGIASGGEWRDDLCRDVVPAETVGLCGTGDPRKYRSFTDDEWAFWNRMIRCVYKDEKKVEWDSLGNTKEYQLDPKRPCWQAESVSGVDVPPEEERLFETPIHEFKANAEASKVEEGELDASITDHLENLGYL